jgi:DNA-binding LacI/PurR family transcriptional regulator
MHDIGVAATDLLLRRLRGEGGATPVSRLITPELRVRMSSARSAARGASE